MTVHALSRLTGFAPANLEPDRAVASVYCCDLLSAAMSRAPGGCAWVTVIGNSNVVAVASLAEVACVVIADGKTFDPAAVAAAAGRVTLLMSGLPAYETAVKIGALL